MAEAIVCHVINLARSPERWQAIQRLAGARALDLNRIDAVDGSDPAALARAGYRPDPEIRHLLRPTEIACFESHKRAWAAIAARSDRFGVVFEDDVSVAADLASVVLALAEACPGLDVVKLNANPRGVMLRQTPIMRLGARRVMAVTARSIDASAYLISRAYAEQALDIHRSYAEPVDRVLFDPALCPQLAQIDPAITVQAKYLDGVDPMVRRTTQLPRVQPEIERPSVGLTEKARLEGQRLLRRRVLPRAQPLLNLFRAPSSRLAFRRVPFRD
jgi:GR25 family glycosyltransferase involved in LPS biosynthesis